MQKLFQNTGLKAAAVIVFIVATVVVLLSALGLVLISEGSPYSYSSTISTEIVSGTEEELSEDYEIITDEYGNSYYYYPDTGMLLQSNMQVSITGEHDFFSYCYNKAVQREEWLVPLLVISIILFFLSLIFLMCAAGHHKGEEKVRGNALDRVPLDLFLAIAIGLGALLLMLCVDTFPVLQGYIALTLFIIAVAVFSLLLLVTLMSCATRFKMGKWWQNSIIYKLIALLVARPLRWLWGKLRIIFGNINILWKSIVLFIVFAIVAVSLCFQWAYGSGGAALFLFLLGIAALVLLTLFLVQLNTLRHGSKQLASGNLNYRVDTRNMFKSLKKHGENLNRVGDGMAAAVEERMKSEHFKTELITNVSHDLKTPLTSIINYVDLLQKENIDNPKVTDYLEVLARQSARLKKLTEDLVEASKASTGNVKMDLSITDMNELMAQLMGEYEERFQEASLNSVVNIPEERLLILADGRSLWRIFDNLLNNICKYSQPDTRVFLDLSATRELVTVSLKNTSRDMLNIAAEDLMERFVRGDSSRNSEGSGLGLSIARSLTELQEGTMHLEVDGDLFKVKISFRRAYD